MPNVKIKGGHSVEVTCDKDVLLTDDSGETCRVDQGRSIIAHKGGGFDIPVNEHDYTPTNAEEAFYVASHTDMPIVAGGRWFKVKQSFAIPR